MQVLVNYVEPRILQFQLVRTDREAIAREAATRSAAGPSSAPPAATGAAHGAEARP